MFLKWGRKEKTVVQMLQTEQSKMVCTVSETALVESAFLFHCGITPQTDLFCSGGICPGPLSQCSLFSCLWFCYMSLHWDPSFKTRGCWIIFPQFCGYSWQDIFLFRLGLACINPWNVSYITCFIERPDFCPILFCRVTGNLLRFC